MEYGSILAKQFDVPQRQQQGQQVGRRGAGQGAQRQEPEFKYDDILAKAPEGLERSNPDIAEQTAKYYQNWADLRSFVKTMWTKYKIDVQAPDPENPDTVWANQAYNQKLALLLDGVDNAKNSQKTFEADQQAAREGKIRTKDFNTYSAQTQAGDRFTANYIESPEVANLNKGALNIRPSEAKAENQKRETIAQDFDKLAQEATTKGDTATADFYTQQARNARAITVFAAENSTPSSFGGGFNQADALATDVVKLVTGTHPDFKKTEIIDPTTKARVFRSGNNKLLNSGTVRVSGKPAIEIIFSGGTMYAVNEDYLKDKVLKPTNSLAFNKKDAYEVIQGVSQAAGLGKEVEESLPKWKQLGFLQETNVGSGVVESRPEALLSTDERKNVAQFEAEQNQEADKIKGSAEKIEADALNSFEAMLGGENWWQKMKRNTKNMLSFSYDLDEGPEKPISFSTGAKPGYQLIITPQTVDNARQLVVTETNDAGEPVSEPAIFKNPAQVKDFVKAKLGFNDLYIKAIESAQPTQTGFVDFLLPDGRTVEISEAAIPEFLRDYPSAKRK